MARERRPSESAKRWSLSAAIYLSAGSGLIHASSKVILGNIEDGKRAVGDGRAGLLREYLKLRSRSRRIGGGGSNVETTKPDMPRSDKMRTRLGCKVRAQNAREKKRKPWVDATVPPLRGGKSSLKRSPKGLPCALF